MIIGINWNLKITSLLSIQFTSWYMWRNYRSKSLNWYSLYWTLLDVLMKGICGIFLDFNSSFLHYQWRIYWCTKFLDPLLYLSSICILFPIISWCWLGSHMKLYEFLIWLWISVLTEKIFLHIYILLLKTIKILHFRWSAKKKNVWRCHECILYKKSWL